jgi:hypothetical protein
VPLRPSRNVNPIMRTRVMVLIPPDDNLND